MKSDSGSAPQAKWRLKKTLSRKLEFRPIEKEDLRVLGDPMFWVTVKDKKSDEPEGKEQLLDMPTALQHMKLPEDGDLEFKCEVEVKPEFELPPLEGAEIERPDVKVTDEDVTTQIDRERARRGNWVPVNDGKVAIDDLLICDMVMAIDGKEHKKQENMQLAARAQRIEGITLEDLGETFSGAKVGDTKKLSTTIPDDHDVEALRGKKAEFEFKLNDIKRMELPPLNKEYLSNQGFESEKEYRDYVKDNMTRQVDQEIKSGMRGQVRKFLMDEVKLDLPEGVSGRMTARVIMQKMLELQRQGMPMHEIEKHADELALMDTQDMGKPYAHARQHDAFADRVAVGAEAEQAVDAGEAGRIGQRLLGEALRALRLDQRRHQRRKESARPLVRRRDDEAHDQPHDRKPGGGGAHSVWGLPRPAGHRHDREITGGEQEPRHGADATTLPGDQPVCPI